MAEIIEAQQEISDNITTYPSKGDNIVYGMALFCGRAGTVIEGIHPYLDENKLPANLKRDLWEFAVVAAKLRNHAKDIRTGATTITADTVEHPLGDIGTLGKQGLANITESLIELLTILKVNLREVVEIARGKRSA